MAITLARVLFVALFAVFFIPELQKNILSLPFYGIYKVIAFFQQASPHHTKYNWSLKDNFAPVSRDQRFVVDIKPSFGRIPTDIDGFCVKNGPNPDISIAGNYHWFDGDGMLHGVRIANGKANYTNLQINTTRLQNEKKFGWPVNPRIGEMRGFSGVARIYLWKLMKFVSEYLPLVETNHSSGTQNTATVFHHNTLMALVESELPYEIRIMPDGHLNENNLGFTSFGGKWNFSFTAHPKVDPVTGELVFFSYNLEKKPYCNYGVADRNGNVISTLPIELPNPIMMHDFAITEHYSIIMDLPLVFDPKIMVMNNTNPFIFNATRGGRFGIFNRYEKNPQNIKWFSVPSCYVFHPTNAWEEGDNVILFAIRYDSFDMDLVANEELPQLYKWTFNMKTGQVTGHNTLLEAGVEFGKVRDSLVGRKSQYAYIGTIVQGTVLFSGIVKVDLSQNGKLVEKYSFGENIFGGDMAFVPRTGSDNTREDDGYIIGFIHDQNVNQSSVIILNAATFQKETVLTLPYRVPYGFHVNWVPGNEFS